MSTSTLTREQRKIASDKAWDAYMAQRQVENAAEAASKAANYQDAELELARERAERKATRLLRTYQRKVDHIRAD